MSPGLKNAIGIVVGLAVCMGLNGALVGAGSSLIPPPEGVDPNNLDSIKANIHRYGPKHFVVPLVAHAAGSFVGAWIAAILAASRKRRVAMMIGIVHLIGGIVATYMIPAPVWFISADLLFAYLPMAHLAARVAAPFDDS